MQWVDYITLMLANMVAALLLLAGFVLWGLNKSDRACWAPAFFVTGLVALATGLHMALTWPIPPEIGVAYNAAFGETTVLLGALLLGAALALRRNWPLAPLTILAPLAGAVGVAVGVLIYQHSMTQKPLLSMLGFVSAGGAGVIAPLVLKFRRRLAVRLIAAAALLIAAGVWALTLFGAYAMHFSRWSP
jgi:putative membrane protein